MGPKRRRGISAAFSCQGVALRGSGVVGARAASTWCCGETQDCPISEREL